MNNNRKGGIIKAMELGLSLREYQIVTATLKNVKDRLFEINACTGCFMADVCKKYGKHADCMKHGLASEFENIIDESVIVAPDGI